MKIASANNRRRGSVLRGFFKRRKKKSISDDSSVCSRSRITVSSVNSFDPLEQDDPSVSLSDNDGSSCHNAVTIVVDLSRIISGLTINEPSGRRSRSCVARALSTLQFEDDTFPTTSSEYNDDDTDTDEDVFKRLDLHVRKHKSSVNIANENDTESSEWSLEQIQAAYLYVTERIQSHMLSGCCYPTSGAANVKSEDTKKSVADVKEGGGLGDVSDVNNTGAILSRGEDSDADGENESIASLQDQIRKEFLEEYKEIQEQRKREIADENKEERKQLEDSLIMSEQLSRNVVVQPGNVKAIVRNIEYSVITNSRDKNCDERVAISLS